MSVVVRILRLDRVRQIVWKPRSLAVLLACLFAAASPAQAAQEAQPPIPLPAPPQAKLTRITGEGVPQGIVVRTSENVTKGGWVYLLNRCEALGIERIDLLIKQDEDHFVSPRTGQTLESGDLLVPLPGEACAKGWEDASWLREMLARAHEMGIQVWAWWPCFHDAAAAQRFPEAAYSSIRKERFVDPGVPEVRERQEKLLAKLLDTYPFDGVSLDWLRYEGWYAGSTGPLGEKFERQYHVQWKPGLLDNEYPKARWYEMRARLLADWVDQLVRGMRATRSGVRWGAFLLPWHFSGASQSYPMLGASRLDYLQPMCYWPDWKKQPEWVGHCALSLHSEMTDGTSQWACLGLDAPEPEIRRALASIASGSISGLSWFTYGTWEEKCFRKLHRLTAEDAPSRRFFGFDPPELPPVPEATPEEDAAAAPDFVDVRQGRIEAKDFPNGSSVWAVVALGELYRRKAIDPVANPEQRGIVPVIALHTFSEGTPGSQSYLYRCSTGYLDGLLDFLARSEFTVCPLSRLQSYLITRDPSFLPPRPLILTVDDGSESVYKIFYPRVLKEKFPFTLALVTSWLAEGDTSTHSTDEPGRKDPSMTWKEAQEIYRSGLAEIISHSDAMHYQTGEGAIGNIERPAETTRQFLKEYGRTETNGEYATRIRTDMMVSRAKLAAHGFGVPSIFCWPYGENCPVAVDIAEEAGFTHFLLFDTPPVFATPSSSLHGIPRIPVLRPDETLPLRFPEDPAEQQAWWLAFLKVAADSRSPDLITATLRQLTHECQRSPEAEIARAERDYLRGDAASGSGRLLALRAACPFETKITGAIDAALRQFNPPPK